MNHFHYPFRGWLAQRLHGRAWWLLGLFLLFYVGLSLEVGQDLLRAHHVVAVSEAPEDCAISQARSPHFLGLP